MNTSVLLWAIAAFVCGAFPFSLWIGRLALGKDIRTYGDSNPGATNVLRAGGRSAALVALVLDFLKGAIPVGAAYGVAGLDGWTLVIVSIMPVLGHAFSPFLGFRGGKAVAVTGGIWCGLTAWEGTTVGGLLLGLGVYLFGANGWAVLFGMSGMLVYFWGVPPLAASRFPRPDFSILLTVWLFNMAILIWKHRADFRRAPHIRRAVDEK